MSYIILLYRDTLYAINLLHNLNCNSLIMLYFIFIYLFIFLYIIITPVNHFKEHVTISGDHSTTFKGNSTYFRSHSICFIFLSND